MFNGKTVGFVKHLKFFETRSDGKKFETNWLMKEYTIDKDQRAGDNTTFNKLGLCKIYKKERGARSNQNQTDHIGEQPRNAIEASQHQDSVPTFVPIKMMPCQESASVIIAQHHTEMMMVNQVFHNQITDRLLINNETSITQELTHPGSSGMSEDDSQNKVWDSETSPDQDSTSGIEMQRDDEMMTDDQLWIKEIGDALLTDSAPLERMDLCSLEMSKELQNWIQDLL